MLSSHLLGDIERVCASFRVLFAPVLFAIAIQSPSRARHFLVHGLDQVRQRRLCVARDRQVGREVTLEVLVVRFLVQVADTDCNHSRIRARPAARLAVPPVRHGVDETPGIVGLESENYVSA